MKRMRLLVVPASEAQFNDAVANLPEDDVRKQEKAIRERMILKYKAVIQTALRTPLDGAQGIPIEEMERSLALLKVVDAAEDGSILELEDADHDYLVQKLAKVRWYGFDPRIVTFVHTIRNATKDVVEMASAPPPNGVNHDSGVPLSTS